MKKRITTLAFLAGLSAVAENSHAQAPSPIARAPALAPAPDAAFEAARVAFEALPEAERRGLQQALIWTGDYKGTTDGGFGKGTRAAIIAWATRTKRPPDGTLDPAARAALVAAGDKAAASVGFARLDDPSTGAVVGVPLALLSRVAPSAIGRRWTSPDGTVSFETMALAEEPGRDLAAVFAGSIGEGPDRKVSYKVLRPDFFVVSGESRGATFYTRLARGMANGRPVLRGYTLAWPTARRDLEPVSIAVANAYAPFPAAPVGAPSAAAPPARPVSAPAAPVAVAPPVVAPATRVFGGTALELAPGRYVAAPPAEGCRDPRIGPAPARLVRSEPGSGLWLVETPPPSGRPTPVPPVLAPEPAPGADLVLVFLAPSAEGSSGPGEPPRTDLLAAAGQWQAATGGGAPRVVAPLQGPVGGALAFDRAGRLAGMVSAPARAPRLVAGVVPQASWSVVAPSALAAFTGLKVGDAATADVSAAAVAGRARPLAAALTCAP